MIPTLTDAQKEQGKKQLTTEEIQDLRVSDHATLKTFYTDWLDAFAPVIIEAACEKCLPPWLLASIVLGEVTAMDTYLGIDERTLEEWGLGDSIGLAQILKSTAEKYGLTPFTSNEAGVRNSIARKLGELWTLEAIVAELVTKPLDDLDLSPPPIGSPPVDSTMVTDLYELIVRWELLNPILSIRASACYLRNLLEQAIATGQISGYKADGTEPWGQFDFSDVVLRPCPANIDAGSENAGGDTRKVLIAKLFGAAHNDDSLGGFNSGYGLTQGENAGAVADDLIGFDLLAQYNLLDCP